MHVSLVFGLSCALAPPRAQYARHSTQPLASPVQHSRRAFSSFGATAIAALFAAPLGTPSAAHAGLFGDDGPQGELRALLEAQSRLDDLAAKLDKGELRGESEEDAIVVLQTLTIQLPSTALQMDKAITQLAKLDASAQRQLADVSTRFATELRNIKQGCRDRSASTQLEGTRAASKAIGDYLQIVALAYKLPELYVAPAYSSDPREFVKQYYGIFSCEGQGLERVPGSNTCRESATDKNINPFPTKNFLNPERDFLTGKPQK
jgi:hypothetical protein